MIIRWTRVAGLDLHKIGQYIALDNPYAAEKVNGIIKRAAESLTEFSARGRPTKVDGIRELVLTEIPYLLVYRISRQTVDILRVRHSATIR